MRVSSLKIYRDITTAFAVILLGTLLFAENSFAQERDPFSPSSGTSLRVSNDLNQEVKQVDQGDSMSDPLTSSKLSSFRIVGTLFSDERKFAAVKAIDGNDYVLNLGDKIGSEGGIVTDININGIVVEMNGSKLNLPVNNKIEIINNENAK
jgi:Tfp pilus assembly protein PilP